MRLVSVRLGGRATWGVLDGDRFVDVGARSPRRWPTLRAFLADRDDAALHRTLASSSADALERELAYRAVIPDPSKVLCVGLNFERHRIETGRPRPERPMIFTRFADTLVGHEQPLQLPHASSQLDYEGELAVVIGRRARAVPRERACDRIAGYAVFQDATLRDFQNHTSQFTPGKNFPATAALGPALVTSEAAGDPGALELITRVNGDVRQQGEIGDLTFSIETIVSYCSTWTELRPGDVIALGTPGGIGSRMTPPRWLVPGDVVEVEVPGVGLLRNAVVRQSPA